MFEGASVEEVSEEDLEGGQTKDSLVVLVRIRLLKMSIIASATLPLHISSAC